MSLFLVTAPTVEPISLTEAKLHCKIDVTADDALIQGAIRAAREYAETATRRALCQQTWDLKLDGFPCDDEPIELPLPPVQSITSITYVDQAGDSQTWASNQYRTSLPAGPHAAPGLIAPIYGVRYPVTQDVMDAVTVRMVNGYSAAAKTITSITRSGSTATVTTTLAHGFSTGQRVTNAGADQAEYNGTFEITVTGAATFTFTVSGSPTTPATGTMTAATLGVPSLILGAMYALVARMNEKREAAIEPGEVSNADRWLWQFKVC